MHRIQYSLLWLLMLCLTKHVYRKNLYFINKFEENARNNTKGGIFQTVFTRGRVEISAPLNPIEFSDRKTDIKFSKLKKLLLIIIICGLTLTVLLIIKQITREDRPEPNTSAVRSGDIGLNLTANQLTISNTTEEEDNGRAEWAVQTTTTSRSTATKESPTDTIVTTEGTTSTTTIRHRIIDHLLASIVINEATVPNKDGYVSLTDTYVKAFVDDIFIGQTPVHKESLTPKWNYQIAHEMTLRPDDVLYFKLYDNDRYSSHDYLGQCQIKVKDLLSRGLNAKPTVMDFGQGKLTVTMAWDEIYTR